MCFSTLAFCYSALISRWDLATIPVGWVVPVAALAAAVLDDRRGLGLDSAAERDTLEQVLADTDVVLLDALEGGVVDATCR